ncbi:MAG TPA: HEAT repeat domain-containing protein [Ignavibacteriaceae bacterium]
MNTIKRQTIAVIALLLLFVMAVNMNVFAQPNPISNVTKNEYALDNLKAAINSENTGVRKSSIYFAGKYKIAEAVKCLVERLENEEDASVRLLIAYSLYEIKDEAGMKAVKQLSLNDDDIKVKKISFNLYEKYLNNGGSTAAL